MIQKNERSFESVYKTDPKPVGTGGFGVVCKCKHLENGQDRAVKIVSKKKIKNMQKFQQEIIILQQLDHPNVLKLYEYFEDRENIYLVTELCLGGELFDRIIENEFFSERDAARIFKQILQSLNYCHKQSIAHRDLKPENFLFETKSPDSDLKIIDFGLSKILKSNNKFDVSNSTGSAKVKNLERMQTRAGTPNYISPEVLAGNYGVECDLWSAGCILYILLCGYPPFYGDDDLEILQMVQKGKFDFDGEEWEEISKEAKDLIKKLICKPEKRLSAEEALQHKWFKKVLKDKGKMVNIN
jgi:calcium-dependent protein kinase